MMQMVKYGGNYLKCCEEFLFRTVYISTIDGVQWEMCFVSNSVWMFSAIKHSERLFKQLISGYSGLFSSQYSGNINGDYFVSCN